MRGRKRFRRRFFLNDLRHRPDTSRRTYQGGFMLRLIAFFTFTTTLIAQTGTGIQPRLQHAAELVDQGKLTEARSELNNLKTSYPQEPQPLFILALIDVQ